MAVKPKTPARKKPASSAARQPAAPAKIVGPGTPAPASPAQAVQPVVQMVGIEKQFPGVHALRSARFDLRAGEVHALMGENGAGKSTLMKILTGVYQEDSGEIIFEGRTVKVPSPKAAQDLGISIIHQELNLMNHLTAAQNIFIGREERVGFGLFTNDAAINRKAAAIFARMKVNIEPTVEVGTLTVAKQQLVEIAKALSFDSKVLIMD
jgi:ribose transport system ATP-binding protein